MIWGDTALFFFYKIIKFRRHTIYVQTQKAIHYSMNTYLICNSPVKSSACRSLTWMRGQKPYLVCFLCPQKKIEWIYGFKISDTLRHGSPAPLVENRRMKVSPEKLNHFLTFITNQYVMQDLPFGEKTLKLSSNPEINVPNVLRTMVPHLIVQQYHSHCQETGFLSMSSTTPCRILKSMCANPFKDLIMSQQRVQKRLKNQQMSSKTKCQPPRQRPLMAKRPEQSCWFELFSDTLFATLLEVYYLTLNR